MRFERRARFVLTRGENIQIQFVIHDSHWFFGCNTIIPPDFISWLGTRCHDPDSQPWLMVEDAGKQSMSVNQLQLKPQEKGVPMNR
jgi:hypothetical protein